jgi:hypothetical protein
LIPSRHFSVLKFSVRWFQGCVDIQAGVIFAGIDVNGITAAYGKYWVRFLAGSGVNFSHTFVSRTNFFIEFEGRHSGVEFSGGILRWKKNRNKPKAVKTGKAKIMVPAGTTAKRMKITRIITHRWSPISGVDSGSR